MPRILILATFVFAILAVEDARSQSSTEFDTVLIKIQRASASGDRETIAAMVRYPITVAIGGFRVPFADSASFLSRYDDIFNPRLRQAIADASVQSQPGGGQISVTAESFVIGTGEVVLEVVDGQLRIVSIAVPDFFGSEHMTLAPRAELPTAAVQEQEPRRIAIRVGARATQIPGLLTRDATDSFMLYLPKGQLAGIRLERVPAGAAAIRVVHARTGAPLGTRTSADGRFVTGRPAEGADYRIDVRRTGNDDEAPLPYMLSLSLR